MDYWKGEFLQSTEELDTAEEFQDALLNIPVNNDCEVCVRGALMLSTIRLGNTIAPDDFGVQHGSEDIIKGFSMLAFRQMEVVYEQFIKLPTIDLVGFHPEYTFVHTKLLEIAKLYEPSSKELLANILLNVIVNGDFKYEDATDYVKQFKIL